MSNFDDFDNGQISWKLAQAQHFVFFSVAKFFSSLETKMITNMIMNMIVNTKWIWLWIWLRIPNETFLRIIRYLILFEHFNKGRQWTPDSFHSQWLARHCLRTCLRSLAPELTGRHVSIEISSNFPPSPHSLLRPPPNLPSPSCTPSISISPFPSHQKWIKYDQVDHLRGPFYRHSEY